MNVRSLEPSIGIEGAWEFDLFGKPQLDSGLVASNVNDPSLDFSVTGGLDVTLSEAVSMSLTGSVGGLGRKKLSGSVGAAVRSPCSSSALSAQTEPFDGSDQSIRSGAVCSAMWFIGQAPQRKRWTDLAHRRPGFRTRWTSLQPPCGRPSPRRDPRLASRRETPVKRIQCERIMR